MQHLIRDTGPIIFHHVPREEPSLPRLLRSAGYTTAHIGKWHLSFVGRDGEPSMKDYGYDFSMVLGASRHGSYRDSKWLRNGKRYETPNRWTAEVYVDEAIDFIEKAGERPFFINLWSFAPHQEVDCAAKYRKLYRNRTESEQYFYGAITQMDEEYGRLLDYLDETGLADKTIVIFSSDNGPEPHLIPWSDRARGSTGGLRGGKHHLYDGGIRVPGIVRWPGVTRSGSVVREACWTPDILASLCAANRISTSSDHPIDGVDIRGALQGHSLRRIQPLYWQFPFGVDLRNGTRASAPGLALRDGSWKLHCDPEFKHVELYNLDIDEDEKWNVHDEYPEVTARLMAKMQEFNSDVNGTYSKTARYLNPLMMKSSSPPAKNTD
jgi:arylsulfatase A-like enzyme